MTKLLKTIKKLENKNKNIPKYISRVNKIEKLEKGYDGDIDSKGFQDY